jgi:hypothetical protein
VFFLNIIILQQNGVFYVHFNEKNLYITDTPLSMNPTNKMIISNDQLKEILIELLYFNSSIEAEITRVLYLPLRKKDLEIYYNSTFRGAFNKQFIKRYLNYYK